MILMKKSGHLTMVPYTNHTRRDIAVTSQKKKCRMMASCGLCMVTFAFLCHEAKSGG